MLFSETYYSRLDDHGHVINEASVKKVTDLYLPIIEKVVNSFRERWGSRIYGIYLRGSVPHGRAVPFYSDVDFVVILKSKATKDELKWSQEIVKAIESLYDYVPIVDLAVTDTKQIFTKEYTRLRTNLKAFATCLYGEDIRPHIEHITPGYMLSYRIYEDFLDELEDLKEYFVKGGEKEYQGKPRPTEFWCTWTMRTLLRSSIGLVMRKRKIYTNHVETCFYEFSKEFPSYIPYMKQAFFMERYPISDREKIAQYLDYFIPRYLNLWQYQ